MNSETAASGGMPVDEETARKAEELKNKANDFFKGVNKIRRLTLFESFFGAVA